MAAFIFLQAFGFLCFIILFFGAGQIAIWMNDPHLAVLLKVVSVVFLLFPIVSVMRGYYQGNGDMVPTGISQVGEQSIRVLTIIVLAYWLTEKGDSLYLVGAGAMFGSITGSMISAVILFTFLSIRKEWKQLTFNKENLPRFIMESGWVFKALMIQGLAICLSGMLMIFIQMADAMNLYSLLVSNGLGKEAAKSLKGVYDRGQPLIQMGTVAATSMSLSLVPLIASERLKKKREFLSHKIRMAMQISAVVGLGASAGLWAIIKPVNIMLFQNDSGSAALSVLSFVILFSSIISTQVAIMQGLEKLWFPALMITISFPVKYELNMLLVPHLAATGAALSTLITLALVCSALGLKLRTIMSDTLYTGKFLRVVIFAAILMVLFLKGYLYETDFLCKQFVSMRAAKAVQALSAALFGALVFLWMVIRGNIFSEEDLSFVPFGSKLALFLKHKKRRYGNDE